MVLGSDPLVSGFSACSLHECFCLLANTVRHTVHAQLMSDSKLAVGVDDSV